VEVALSAVEEALSVEGTEVVGVDVVALIEVVEADLDVVAVEVEDSIAVEVDFVAAAERLSLTVN